VSADKTIEEGKTFTPKFDENGLIAVIAQDSKTNQILMVAYMNRQALDKTIATGQATYYSRSRKKLWTKGEQSGHTQKVDQILVDCDQDCLILKVSVDSGQCHVGYNSCFYRALKKGTACGEQGRTADNLDFIAEKTYNPDSVYKK